MLNINLKQNSIFFIILFLIIIVCAVLWLWSSVSVARLPSDSGARDLRDADFAFGGYDLYGPVEYIPNTLLSPPEFAARQDEIQLGEPPETARFCTSRLRVYVPEGTYGLMMWNAEFATNIYINGRLAESVGTPAVEPAHSVAAVKLLYYTADAPDGVIEILQQASNYVLPENFGHADIILGTPENVRDIYNGQIFFASAVMGCFLALALAHLVLYSLFRFQKANLWFALFCVAWFLRTGYTGSTWILSSVFPLSFAAVVRMGYLPYPAGVLFLCLALNALLPGVMQKWFCAALTAVCGAFAFVFLFANTMFLKNALPYFYAVIIFTVIYIFIRLCIKVRKPDAEQIAVITGVSVFIFGVLRDIWNFVVPSLLPAKPAVSTLTMHTTAEYALLAFVFLHMAAVFRGTMRAIAEARDAEQRLAMEAETQQRLNVMKSEFMGELSHELRIPISVISGFAQYISEVLDDDTVDRADLRNSARRVESETERMDRMVSQLLDMAAIEAGRFTLRKEIVSVSELFNQIRHVYFPMMNTAYNRLTVNLDDELFLYADRERILQVLVNLVSNACKYTEEGEITLAAEPENAIVRFSVADTGEGMTPETFGLLFTRYPETQSGTKGVAGNGLGLFISKKLAEAHGGEIGVESEAGKGTKAWFTIPVGGDGGNE